MRTITVCMASSVLLCGSSPAGAEPIAAKSRIVSLGLFKNGLAVVKRVVEMPPAGSTEKAVEFEVADVPEPVHGTFWIESNADVRVRVTSREEEAPFAIPGADLQGELAGRSVTIRLRDPALPAITGKVVAFKQDHAATWDRDYRATPYDRWGSWSPGFSNVPAPPRFLIIQNESGRTYVDSSMIASLQVDGSPAPIKQRKPVLILSVQPRKNAASSPPAPVSIAISYLSKGMTWAPSYRADVSDSKSVSLTQQAVLRNEMADFEDVEVSLISGFPNIEFAHVDSPLSPRATLASFFQQLNDRWRRGGSGLDNQVMQQQAVAYNSPGPASGIDLSAPPEGEGVDLHFEPIGKITMKAGDSLMLTVASGHGDYERIVEWVVPDTRDPNGNFIADWQREQNPDKYEDALWDALRFRNPLPFAMTTAPAMVVSGDKFNGQRTSLWVNAGEQTSLRITKALSIRTRQFEQEEPGERPILDLGGRKFRKASVKGELTAANHRNETVTLVIRRQFSGDLISADESPKVVLRDEGVYSINRRNELNWTLKLEPGADKTLTYRYEVLVPH